MSTEKYWPQNTVFLFGQFALFPQEFEGKKDKFTWHPSSNSMGDFVTELRKYEQNAYFNIETMLSTDYIGQLRARAMRESRIDIVSHGLTNNYEALTATYGLGEVYDKIMSEAPLTIAEVDSLLIRPVVNGIDIRSYLRFKFSNIDQQKCRTKLVTYLTKYQQDALTTGALDKPMGFVHQREILTQALCKKFSEHGYHQIVSLQDAAVPNFWELVFSLHLVSEDIQLMDNLGYEGRETAPGTLRAQKLPYAEFIIVSERLKKSVTPLINNEQVSGHELRKTSEDKNKSPYIESTGLLCNFIFNEKGICHIDGTVVCETIRGNRRRLTSFLMDHKMVINGAKRNSGKAFTPNELSKLFPEISDLTKDLKRISESLEQSKYADRICMTLLKSVTTNTLCQIECRQ